MQAPAPSAAAASSPAAPSLRRPYFPELDGVRALAALMIMAFHMGQQGIPLPGPVILGQTGVDLFFVLSGFLITTILLQSPGGDWHEVRTFYVRRALRIFPLYYAFLLAALAFGLHSSWPFWVYLQNLFLAFNHPLVGPNHFWSLAVEEQFYLIWPFVVLFLPRRWLLPALWSMIAGALLCRLVLVPAGISPFYFTLSRIDGLAAGAVLAVLQSRDALARLRRPLLAITLVGLLGTVVEGALAHHAGHPWIQISKFTLITALYAGALGLLLASPPTPATAWLGSAPLRFIGRLSYGLYVFHPVAFAFAFARLRLQPAPIRALAGLALAFALSIASWYLLERHCIALKARLAPERARFPADAPPMTSL